MLNRPPEIALMPDGPDISPTTAGSCETLTMGGESSQEYILLPSSLRLGHFHLRLERTVTSTVRHLVF